MSVTYACPACHKPGLVVTDSCPKDFVIKYMLPDEKDKNWVPCTACGQRYLLYPNPNPPGRVVLKRKLPND